MNGELVRAWEKDGDAGEEGEEEVLHVDPLQSKADMLTPLQKNRWEGIPNARNVTDTGCFFFFLLVPTLKVQSTERINLGQV